MSVDLATPPRRSVFVTGGTGYIGCRVIPMLVARGHRVRRARATNVDIATSGWLLTRGR